jgi:predicted nucleic acid-binding protein
MILVDANVLIDIVVAPSQWTDWSQQQLVMASKNGLAINLIIYAEMTPCFSDKQELDNFLKDLKIVTLNFDEEVAYRAARAHSDYRAAGGTRALTLPDFFIGAHAQQAKLTLLTRDPKRIRTYFSTVVLITPQGD